MLSCKRCTPTKFVRPELTVETMASPKHGKIIRKVHVPNKKETWLPLFWADLTFEWFVKMSWYSACLLLSFFFRTNGKKGHLDENGFRHCYGNFFEKGILKVTWSALCSKSFLNSYEAHWKQHFERYPVVLYFKDMDQHAW